MSPVDTILDKAKQVVYADREASYGHPKDHHATTAHMWSAWLSRRLRREVTLVASDVGILFILDKCVRQAQACKRDNLVDIAGYAAVVERVLEQEIRHG